MFSRELVEQFQLMETPFYYYDLSLLERTLSKVSELSKRFNFDVHYAVKANSNRRILEIISSKGFGADCVSGNEVSAAIEAGFPANEVLFAGVGKTDREIELALNNKIQAFNCESIEELSVINEIAERLGVTTEVALRINPNVDAKTHKYITTGLDENKFGINQQDLPEILKSVAELKNIELTGIHFHIGSQITDMNVFKGLCIRVNQIAEWFQNHNINLKSINLGGGLGINYLEPDSESIPDFKTYFEIFNEFLDRKLGQKIYFELGRSIIAQCGSLISRVVFVKGGINTQFAILDAGMTELMRPALYQSYHKIENLVSEAEIEKYDVVGPICESTDCFGKAVELPKTKRGDLIAIRSAGAYGEVMTSNYNLREKLPPFYR